MASRLTPQDKQHILDRYHEGASLCQIAREVGRPDITVRRTLESFGVTFGEPRTSNKRSSPETEALVVRLYDAGLTWKEICTQASVTSTTISKILNRNGRDFERKGSSEGKEELIAAMYGAGQSTRDIGALLGLGKSTVNAVIQAGGGTLRQGGCEYPDYFECVDTPQKAYWLGFITADGCIVASARKPEGDRLSVKLAIRDHDHLVKLKDALQASGDVVTGVQDGFGNPVGFASLSVGSPRLVASLLNLGVTPRKSTTAEPWRGPAELMPHYWRGMIDGDGSLARKGDGLWTIFLCGSEACVRAFTAWAGEVCGTGATPFYKGGCWYIGVSGRHQVPNLVRALYYDAPVSLDRKQEIADQILHLSDRPRG